ncbi:MAG: hypothetical protein WCJ30_27425 [Deltaproteobacteria bacterium]
MHERLSSLVGAVGALIDTLEREGLPYAFGGAIALSAWSEPRATTDIDLNLWIEDPEIAGAAAVLARAGVTLDASTAVAQADATGMFYGRHGDYRVDIFVPSIPFYAEALKRRRRVRLADRDTWVLSAECLTVFKMLFFRPKDLVDVARLLSIAGEGFDRGYVRHWLIETMGEDDLRVVRWDRLVAAPESVEE